MEHNPAVVVIQPNDKIGQVMTHMPYGVNPVANFVMDLVKQNPVHTSIIRWQFFGFTSFRQLTPQETVDRASEIADKMFAEFEKRGWTYPMPEVSSLVNTSNPVGFDR